MSEQVIIEGIIEDIIFHNEENGYTVCSIETAEEEIICVGTLLGVNRGENIKVVGSWVTHPIYGPQLQVNTYEKTVPKTEEGIERYLSSGVIKGIGPKLAKRIVERFGLDTLRIIEEEWEKLEEIKGISKKKAVEIGEIFHEQRELRKAILFLQDYGVSPTYALKIYKQYGENTINIIKNNPYRLAEDIFGIGFKMADRIAQNIGISKDSPNRVKAGIKFILNQYSNNGHTYMLREHLKQAAWELLGVTEELVENALIELQIYKQIWQEKIEEKEVVYLTPFYYAEMNIARKLIEFSRMRNEINSNEIDKRIDQLEKETNIKLAKQQRQAVKEAMSEGMLIITGGPGTGKTTTINAIISLLEEEGLEIILAAPTGRAAKRMSEATGKEAQTIHRLLEISFLEEDHKKQVFERNEERPLEADVIIIDEMSMVDVLLMNSFLKAVVEGTRLIFVGDVDQLPSVGPGNVLKDMIKSETIKVVRLTEVFRQARESAIIMNAHRINKGEYPIVNEKDKDFFFIRRNTQEEVIETIKDLILNRLPNFSKCNSIKDIQVLAPMRKSILGVNYLNSILQEALNPPSKEKNEKEYRMQIFREGDKVMQIKNNYNIPWKIYSDVGVKIDEGVGVFNGDAGRIVEIDNEAQTLTVLFDDLKTVEYDFSQLDELELAYAVTIHKSQGSEYPVVIIPVHSGPPMLMNRNLLYTAVTRAKKLVVIVGLQSTLNRMVDNNREINRYSALAYRLTKMKELSF
ncbi:SF1B family DNA helicase RecD2 [Defluviitalea phaphyphila]|uniref:SF1B family DNA helicase RecD2 n=1 Tax=Defluviitalea phaphyphila TaxID=1473580 RepID=UPI000731C2E5|nr:ATP-dependent RecD-like DNA helicase [Defluviitalea phaphyphila]